MTLSVQQQMLIEQRITNEAKSTGAAYLLWVFLGGLGGHRFYLGRTGTAFVQLLLCILGWATVAIGIGIVLLIVLAMWVLVDAFLIPGMVQEQKDNLRSSLSMTAMLANGAAQPPQA
ncbi:TM2 domain-containing protein [Phyllobacterium leguminum]|uniref:TM2 domain-containing membrane protein YozV n=1 Tax=Phyllobacterium leguminum TaxID=314237 RepID=A0A318T1L0_9HYPH|nr:TM2 domain-containing protein [Phyllobacterium leguminum]PYE88411.1 TM2 domain-containing membrane protein YozV [Phyllobacterium leguminum]